VPTRGERYTSRAKSAVKSLIRRGGWQLQRIESRPPNHQTSAPERTALETAMAVALACQPRMRVVQVGANDGRLNDPLHSFLLEHRDRTEVLLIEPQPYLIPALSENYKDHPAATIANLAVGRPGVLKLHAVDKDCWGDCHADYAAGWPPYRAPTGVTSGDPEHVFAWLRQTYRGPLPLDQVVVTLEAECMPLLDLVERVGFGTRVDVIQVDVEGFDDEVLYQSSIEKLAPLLINFEHFNLPADRLTKLYDFLIGIGYELQCTGADTLCIRTRDVFSSVHETGSSALS
jgi:FkbM family methyltransferase